jgi:hypothetical protein
VLAGCRPTRVARFLFPSPISGTLAPAVKQKEKLLKRIIMAVLMTAILAASVMVTSGQVSAVQPSPPVAKPYVVIDDQTKADHWVRTWHWYDPTTLTIYFNRSETAAAGYSGALGAIVNAALGGTPFVGWTLSGYSWLAKLYYGWGYCLSIRLHMTLGGIAYDFSPSLNHCYV